MSHENAYKTPVTERVNEDVLSLFDRHSDGTEPTHAELVGARVTKAEYGKLWKDHQASRQSADVIDLDTATPTQQADTGIVDLDAMPAHVKTEQAGRDLGLPETTYGAPTTKPQEFQPGLVQNIPSEPLREISEWDQRKAQSFWGYSPREIGEDVQDRLQPYVGETGSALGATLMHTGRELMTPLNMGLFGVPAALKGGMGVLKGLRPPEPGMLVPPTASSTVLEDVPVLSQTTPRGGAYSGEEILTPPGSRIEGGFSTGTGEDLYQGSPFIQYPEPPIAPLGKSIVPKGQLPEKTPTFEVQPGKQYTTPSETPSKTLTVGPERVEMGSPGPIGGWTPPPTPTEPGYWKKVLKYEQAKWGQEYPVLKRVPQSPVISEIEGHHVFVENEMETLTQQPWVKGIMKIGDRDGKKYEAQAIADWVAGGKTPEAYEAAVSKLPANLRQMLKERDNQIAVENEIRRRRGLPEITPIAGPYFPRMASQEWRELRDITRRHPAQAATSQSVGAFQQPRAMQKFEEGEKLGVEYEDWRRSFLMREARGRVLQATDKMMTDLEQVGVLHKSEVAARAASPTGEVQPVTGLPFAPEGGKWWVRSKEEAQFLIQNLKSAQHSLGSLSGFAKNYIRNPSLVNPWPHIVKNMGLKQMQQAVVGGLNPARVLNSTFAYRRGKADMLDEFNSVMPFSKEGKTVWDIMQTAGPKGPVEAFEKGIGSLNSFSRGKIFRDWDPAMRYGLWREYVRKGMNLQEAANHTWIDLIRYGTRSDRIDAWESLPFNFFVPWRTGTVRTINKAVQTAPVRAGLFIGAVDTIRELDYRYNGRWTHLPYDYIERPLMTLMTEGPKEGLSTLQTTMVAGPGGEYAFNTIKTMINDVQGKGGISDIRTLVWGMAQVYDLWPQYNAWTKDGDPQHIVDMLGLVAAGCHATPFGAPHRIGEFIPESVIPKSAGVQRAEHRKESIDMMREIRHGRTEKLRLKQYQEPMQP